MCCSGKKLQYIEHTDLLWHWCHHGNWPFMGLWANNSETQNQWWKNKDTTSSKILSLSYIYIYIYIYICVCVCVKQLMIASAGDMWSLIASSNEQYILSFFMLRTINIWILRNRYQLDRCTWDTALFPNNAKHSWIVFYFMLCILHFFTNIYLLVSIQYTRLGLFQDGPI